MFSEQIPNTNSAARWLNTRMEALEQELRTFVVDNFLFGEDREFSNRDSFLDKGLIDSMGVLTLVEFVKERYSITVEDEELVPDNWDSIRRIAAFIESKQGVRK